MRYSALLARGLPTGSGVAEAACKTLVSQRLKVSGIRWSNVGRAGGPDGTRMGPERTLRRGLRASRSDLSDRRLSALQRCSDSPTVATNASVTMRAVSSRLSEITKLVVVEPVGNAWRRGSTCAGRPSRRGQARETSAGGLHALSPDAALSTGRGSRRALGRPLERTCRTETLGPGKAKALALFRKIITIALCLPHGPSPSVGAPARHGR